jgi:hypothetical protein
VADAQAWSGGPVNPGSQRPGGDVDWSAPTKVRSNPTDPGPAAERLSFRNLGSFGSQGQPDGVQKAHEPGLPAWGALAVLLAIAGIGGLIDTMSGSQIRGAFNLGVVVGSIVAILAVRRSSMFPIVIAPPLVYSAASAAMLYVRSSGLNDRKVLLDAAANWLVYGFPAVASATAAVLIIAGIRLIAKR